MGYYHVRITQVSNRSSDEVKLDFALEELKQRVLDPYSKGRPITISGKSIATDDIERVSITMTDRASPHYRPTAERKKYGGGVLSPISVEWYIADLGKDVTDEFITEPPGSDLKEREVTAKESRPSADTRDVFVVHGRNQKARDAVFNFVRSIGLHPLEWSEAVKATGKTMPYIGEILDAAFSQAHAVVVLLTPDDEVRLQEALRSENDPPHETELSGQARPNVLFEAGMAMGRNQDRTVLVELGNLRPFSDMAGLHVIRLDDTSQRRQELAQRLETAGCPVNLDGTDWHSAGEFDAALLSSDTGTGTKATQVDALEKQRFSEMLNASRKIRERISSFLSPDPSTPAATMKFEAQNIVIALGALAGQMSAVGMNELNERLDMRGGIKEKLNKISTMLAYFEGHTMNRNFEGAKQEFASYDPLRDDKGLP